ncbi:amino acid-binding protein, partial [Paenarthrobacter ureafaciens]
NSTPSLWRARTLLLDQPGSLQKITQPLAKLETNILSIHDHLMDGSGLQDTVMDEFVLSAPGNRAEQELLQAMPDGGLKHVEDV